MNRNVVALLACGAILVSCGDPTDTDDPGMDAGARLDAIGSDGGPAADSATADPDAPDFDAPVSMPVQPPTPAQARSRICPRPASG